MKNLKTIDNQEEIQIIVKEIIDMAKKDLVYTKTKPPTNEERDKKNFYHKKSNQTYKIVIKKIKNH